MRRFTAVALLMLAVLGTGFVLQEVRDPDVYTVAGLYHHLPVDEDVTVEGRVAAVEPDYTASDGGTFQRFFLTDGEKEVLVFCDTRRGRAMVAEGDRLRVHARLIRFDRAYELTTVCADGITPAKNPSR